MSHTNRQAAANDARQARSLVRGAIASLTGKTRGPDRKVRRNSFDVDDRRAHVSRRIGDGTTADALGWIDCLLKVVTEWDDLERQKGGGRPLGLAGLRVLETLLGRRGKVALDFKSGRLDPAIDTIAAAAALGRTAVIRALARLKAMGILDWVRRTQATDNAGGYGPQREQITNSYWFSPERMPARVLQRFRDLLARKRMRRTPESAKPDPAPAREPSGDLGRALDALGAAIVNASPPSGQYHRSRVER